MTIRRGPVIVPRVKRPWARLLTRCSTTWDATDFRCPFESPDSSVSATSLVTQSDSVWKGACGMSPFGKGTPSRPATPVVKPRRKRSQ